jgi:hypothetical protein
MKMRKKEGKSLTSVTEGEICIYKGDSQLADTS